MGMYMYIYIYMGYIAYIMELYTYIIMRICLLITAAQYKQQCFKNVFIKIVRILYLELEGRAF